MQILMEKQTKSIEVRDNQMYNTQINETTTMTTFQSFAFRFIPSANNAIFHLLNQHRVVPSKMYFCNI